jgi:predicted O-linked N-acetylglucosamine transferase (SPINDLY family)
MAELFEIHNRDKFEVFAFSLDDAPQGDEIRERLKNAFDQFIDIKDLSDEEAVKLVKSLEIDIAIDLGGHTAFSRPGIFALHAAPIQVNFLGYPGTIGAKYMDYIIADKIVIPESSQQYYTEKIVYLPNSFMPDDSMRVPSTTHFSKASLGLPEDKFIFCCFNNSNKFNRELISRWANILRQVPNSILWLSANNLAFRTNLLQEFLKFKIDADRIIFADRLDSINEHLSRYRLADLFLDTHPYNAHTTAMDALKSGVPILTMLGEAFPGRVAASLLNAANLPELIANSPEEYQALAINLATNPDKLWQIKQKLIQNLQSAPLLNSPLFAHNIESAYSIMYANYQANLPSDHIYIGQEYQ